MKKYFAGIYLAVLVLSVIGLKPAPIAYAGGNSIFVTTTDDELNTDGDCSLREAIQSANTNTAVDQCNTGVNTEADYVTLTGGATYTLTLTGINEDSNATGDLDIVDDSAPSTDISIFPLAGTATINGNDIDRILHIMSGAKVDIFNVILTNGTAGSGGIIFNSGELLLNDVDLINGVATVTGGAIYHDGTTLSIQNNSDIGTNGNGNSALDGGGIYTNTAGATVTVIDSSISYNSTAGRGGAIYAFGSVTLNVTDTQMLYNTTGIEGGAMYAAFGVAVSINTSSFSNNTALGGDGGGILAHDFASFTMQNSTLLYNSASQRAGAIRPISGSSVAQATGNCIVGNTSGSQQDVFNDNITFIPNFTGNWWGDSDGPSGAGPGEGDSVSTNIDYSGFLTSPILGCPDNSSTPTPTPSHTPMPTNTPTDTPPTPVVILVNTTDDELNTDGDCSLREAISAANTNTMVDQCPAGSDDLTDTVQVSAGATYTLTLAGNNEDGNSTGDLDILNNTATTDLSLQPATGTATIDANDIDRVLHVVGGTVEIANMTLTNGTSLIGGILYNNGNLTLSDVTLQNGNATNVGGAIYHTTGTLDIQDSLIGGVGAGNTSVSSGGGIFTAQNGSTITIANSTISYNTGATGAGISIQGTGLTLTVSNSAIDYNTATGSGGGLAAFAQASFSITNSSLSNNSSTTNRGGAIYAVSPTNSTIQSSRLLYNTASMEGGAIHIGSAGESALIAGESCIVGNTSGSGYDVNNGSGNLQNFTDNWWGASDGPSGVAPGSGDSVSADVAYSGFYTSPILGCPTDTPTPTPTDTPITPTVTPITPTNTPVTPSSTPITPTSTPVTPTDTPVTPTLTPTCAIVVVPPTLQSPVHRTHTTDTTPTFTWSQVSGAQSYRLMIYTEDRSFEFKKRRVGQTSTSYTLTNAEALVPAKYLWRVRTQDLGCGTWTKWSTRNTLFID